MLTDSKIMGGVCNKYIRRSLIEQMFNTSLTHCEDCEWLFRVLGDNYNAEIIELSNVLYTYVYRDNSATNSMESSFDENGVIKYIPSFLEMEKIQNLGKNVYYELSASLYFFSLSSLYKKEPSKDAIDELKKLIRGGRRMFFLSKNRSVKTKLKCIAKELIVKKRYLHL